MFTDPTQYVKALYNAFEIQAAKSISGTADARPREEIGKDLKDAAALGRCVMLFRGRPESVTLYLRLQEIGDKYGVPR